MSELTNQSRAGVSDRGGRYGAVALDSIRKPARLLNLIACKHNLGVTQYKMLNLKISSLLSARVVTQSSQLSPCHVSLINSVNL